MNLIDFKKIIYKYLITKCVILYNEYSKFIINVELNVYKKKYYKFNHTMIINYIAKYKIFNFNFYNIKLYINKIFAKKLLSFIIIFKKKISL